jgi:hypothetical protein
VQESTTVLDATKIEPGTNVLVTGPAMTGKRQLLLSLLAAGDPTERGTLFVTTRRDAESTAGAFRRLGGPVSDDRLKIVDCVTRSAGFGTSSPTDSRRYPADPGDLTGIGIEMTGFMGDFHAAGLETWVGFHSLSTVLMYADLRRVFQFVHVLTGRIGTLGFRGAFALDTTVAESRDLEILKQPFDALVELREADAGVELRVRGGQFGPSRWTPL